MTADVLSLTPNRRERTAKNADVVAQLNDTHALILLGDKPAVLKEGVDVEGRPGFRLLSIGGFHEWMRPYTVQRDDRRVPISKLWLAWTGRRQYDGITFTPGREHPGYYNLWKGWAVEPDPDAGSCERLKDHLFENVASGNEAHFAWIVGWFAQLVQQPAEKLGTSLVLRGTQGTGKTIVGKAVGSLLGDHYQLVSDPRYLVGRFNSHLVNCLLLQLDEATWGGDHQAAGKLKDLITGDYQHIEYKGREPVKVRNYLRLFITGNSQWIVPAGLEERRFAVFEMGESARQNHAYFAAIEKELAGGVRPNGGRQALLAYLLDYTLDEIPLREIPQTAALADQKLASLSSEQQWWLDVLMRGQLPGDREGLGASPCGRLYDHYIEHAKRIGTTRRSIETQVGNYLKRVVPTLRRARRTVVLAGDGPSLTYVYEFPSLAACRAAWDAQATSPTSWPDADTAWASDSGQGGLL